MLEELVKLIRELLGGLAPRGRWVVLGSIVLMLCVFLLWVDYVTAWTHYRGLEKRVQLLTQLHELEQAGIRDNPALQIGLR